MVEQHFKLLICFIQTCLIKIKSVMASNMQPKMQSTDVPKSEVQLSVSCRNLLDRDVMSKSDPMCVVFMKSFGKDSYYEYGRSDMVVNSLNPDFSKVFTVTYFFEQHQMLKFEIYDADSTSQKLTDHDLLGICELSLGEIVASPNKKCERQLNFSKSGRALPAAGKAGGGTICIRCEEVSSCKEVVTLKLHGWKLDKKDFLGKSDPYLQISRANADGSFSVIHRTEVIKNDLNPEWRPFTIRAQLLCNGDPERSILVECFDWDNDGSSHDFIGSFQTSLKMLRNREPKDYELINPKKKSKKKSYQNSGKVEVLQCLVETEHTFVDFIQGGLQVNFTVAVDFTASNGEPTDPRSLHYISPNQPTQYMIALQAVGKILQDYDSDKMFPVLGFGGKLPNGEVSHEFALNGNPANPFCAGVPGILMAYQQALYSVKLYGPTNFAPVIQHVTRFAANQRDGSNYFVLLIMTDGIITDMDNTIQAIIQASSLPMSIIIVGVGGEDFSAMEVLDSDKSRLGLHGRYVERDIVQFVPIRQYLNPNQSLYTSEALLAKEVLAELPTQVLEYMKKHGIRPGTGSTGAAIPGTGPAIPRH